MNDPADQGALQWKLLLDGMSALKRGDFSVRLPGEWTGLAGKVADTFNALAEQQLGLAGEIERVRREVGKEGKIQQRVNVRDLQGSWAGLVHSMNELIEELVRPTTEMSRVVGAVAQGDLSRTAELDAGGRPLEGEFLKAARTVNAMVGLLGSFASEVARVAREVGTEGKLGGQAHVPGAAGTWKELTDNVNFMASNLTSQVRDIADVTTAVANGDLSKKVTADVHGEVLELKDKVNTMVDQLRFFTSEVTRVAREVGVEGRLGGQAIAPGAAGTWKELTDNVNQLAANLTTQVRAIAEVASSVTRGDLTRNIRLDARGEVMDLKDTVNQMIANLRVTTQKDADQVWLKTNLARFALMLQGQSNLQAVSAAILTELSKVVGSQHGAFYIAEGREGQEPRLRMLSAFAYQPRPGLPREFGLGEGLVGQCARDKQRILITDPPADYVRISSGLGDQKPTNIVLLPILFEKRLMAVLELASFGSFSIVEMDFLEQLMEAIGIALNTMEANIQTQGLLQNLQSQQEELRNSNQALEEKAHQLALTSKYKSEFLSNMSHELRTPLNSMLILSQQLAEDPRDLSPKQVEYAKTIHASGGDLLSLINDILDLSKVESGTLVLDMADLSFSEMKLHLERVFRHLAERNGLEFNIAVDPKGPDRVHTDGNRLEQILRNLLSNAFKFTEKGRVSLTVGTAVSGWSPDHPVLSQAASVLAFTVTDTGIGIPPDKQRIIFEAFQQADSGTSRKYGGTGLGLSISRELARVLGCQLSLLTSASGVGSSFVLYVPSTLASAPGLAASQRPPALPGPPPPRASALAPLPQPLHALQAPIDDRQGLLPDDVVLLIVEDDPTFAGLILEDAHRHGFKGVVAYDGRSALELADELEPDAVTLDLRLPDMDGWGVLSRFKADPARRHVPVQVIAAAEDANYGILAGAMAFLSKPVTRAELGQALESLRSLRTRRTRDLLVLCAAPDRREALTGLLAGEDVMLTLVDSATAALAALRGGAYDCMVMELPSDPSLEVLRALEQDMAWTRFPIVAHIRGDLSSAQAASLEHAAQAMPLKAVKSMERLLDDTALHLHRVLAAMAPEKRTLIERLYQWAPVLADRKALVVDDDVRNIFAMTSLLENQQMKVLSAESGAEALQLLALHPEVVVVLMDIMMPVMDGYDTMRAIRKEERFHDLPIIAVTAKAMKEDLEKCIQAGASGYISKPVDAHHLLALLRQWLLR